MSRKLSDLRRRKPSRAESQRFILICEGEKTEPAYFKALKANYLGALISIEFVAAAGTPITIKDKAKARMAALRQERRRNPSAHADTVWAVFDRDNHDYIAEAMVGCESAGAKIAYSNPCFEVWLILHHVDYHAADDRHQVQKRYQKLDAKYDPDGSKTPDCTFLLENIEAAEERAENQCKCRVEEDTPLGRPSTTVYKLTRAIRAAAEAAKLKRP